MNQIPFAKIVRQVFCDAKLKAMHRLVGGVSADVYRIDIHLIDGEASSLVLRVHGASHSGHSAELEYNLMLALHRSGVPVPEPLIFDASGNILDEHYVLMRFVEGSNVIPAPHLDQYIDVIADAMARIHKLPSSDLPNLPFRNNPLPQVLNNLPKEAEWNELKTCLRTLTNTEYVEPLNFLHGDIWPGNLLWQNDEIVAILDWEDAAVGDPMSDVANCLLELRYVFGKASMQLFTQSYARYSVVNHDRLVLWQIHAAAAAQRFMSEWGLPNSLEAHMRAEALECLRESTCVLLNTTTR